MIKNYHCGDLLSPALESMLSKKLNKLEKFGVDPTVDIYMSMQGKQFCLKIALKAKSYELMAKAVSDDMYKNIDECVDKLSAGLVEKKVDRTGKKAPEFMD
ncbi:MAG: HPF/RaiA family ribosome-associated protein [Christensenellales bacterium]